MKKVIPAANPDAYVAALAGWQRSFVEALRAAVLEAVPVLEERIKWTHLVYFSNGPVLLIRAEEERVLFGFWRGKRLLHIEPRMTGGGKYELRTLELREGTPLDRATVLELVRAAAALNESVGNPTTLA
ncbi:DUF1801 domain-containing protein [Pseudoduganella sp. OTU4001]|uniref:DUF1801 domain-containing protein n=1 Tax=Pseudoduganella sp. OTU4001 TaxID=3043854 RepID=UPI00313EBA0E